MSVAKPRSENGEPLGINDQELIEAGGDDNNEDDENDQSDDGEVELLLPGLVPVALRLPEVAGSFRHADVCGLHVGLDRVHHLSLLVDHRGQVLEDGVHVNDVGLQLPNGPFAFLPKK